MYANDSGSSGGSQHPPQTIDSLPNHLNIEPIEVVAMLIRDCDDADRYLMREAGKQNGITIEQAKVVYQLGQSGTSRRLLRLFGDKNRPYPVHIPLLHRRKLKGQGSGQASYQYYYAPYVTSELVEQAITRSYLSQSGQIQLETTELNNQQLLNECVVPQPSVDNQNSQVLGQINHPPIPESPILADTGSCPQGLAQIEGDSKEHNDLSSDVEEFAVDPQVFYTTDNLTLEKSVARMLTLMAHKIKELEKEVSALNKRVAKLDKKPQSRPEILSALEAEFENMFAPIEQGQNGKTAKIEKTINSA